MSSNLLPIDWMGCDAIERLDAWFTRWTDAKRLRTLDFGWDDKKGIFSPLRLIRFLGIEKQAMGTGSGLR